MNTISIIILLEVVLLISLSAVLFLSSRRMDTHSRVAQRFKSLEINVRTTEEQGGFIGRYREFIDGKLLRAGIDRSDRSWRASLFVVFTVITISLLRHGMVGGLVAAAFCLTIIYMVLQWLYKKRAEALLHMMPKFIDSIERNLSAGKTIHASLMISADKSKPPLKDVLSRVKNTVELGGDLGEALQNTANTMAVREFQLLAMAIRVHQRYGGNIRGLLRSITEMVKQNEQAHREFMSMTGETRFSAWVLGLLPIGIAGYMMAMNPDYINSMWNDDGGRSMIYTALFMQAAGVLIIWRMIRSI